MVFSAMGALAQSSTTVSIDGKDYPLNKLLERQIGPGTVYTRYRMPTFPLNINIVTVDVTNPYVRIETSTPHETAAGTELLTEAAKRMDAPNHHAITAQNSNFWIVSTQPQWDAYNASTHNINMRNGMLAIDSKSFPHWWWWTTELSGIVGCTDRNELYIDQCRTVQTITSEKTGTIEFTNCNKGFKSGQTSIYTPFFTATRQFLPLVDDTEEQKQNNDIHYTVDNSARCVEVLLNIADGETWSGGRDIRFNVAEVRNNTDGRGTLGDYDLAIVSHISDNGSEPGDKLAQLQPGDEVKINYSYIFNRDGEEVTPEITQAVGGNMMVMREGEITWGNWQDSYNTMIYSRSAYGTSQDYKTLYMITIDKSSDAKYGTSNGCTTAEMCQIVKTLGVWNLINVDAGGSAMLMVDNKIINQTTEGTPRAVGNGWMVFDVSPEGDTEVASLRFYDVDLVAPPMSDYVPQICAYNKYGTLITYDYKDFTVTADAALGTGEGNTLHCAAEEATGNITVTAPNGVSVTRTMSILASTPPATRANPIIIDEGHPYSVEVASVVNGVTIGYDPANISWQISDPSVATIGSDGVLKAVTNGTANLTGNVGSNTFQALVRVETSEEAERDIDKEEGFGFTWKLEGKCAKDLELADDGTLSFTYAQGRGNCYVQLAKTVEIFGLPDKIVLEFENDVPVTKVQFDVRAHGETRTNEITFTPEQDYAVNTLNTLEMPLSAFGDASDRASYPFSLVKMRLYMPNVKTYNGAKKMVFKRLYAVYPSWAAVSDITVGADDSDAPEVYYNLQGMRIPAGVQPAPGIYILRRGRAASKVIIR